MLKRSLWSKKGILILIVLLVIFGLGYYLYENYYLNNAKDIVASNEPDISISLTDASSFLNKIDALNNEDLPPKKELNGYGIRLFDSNGKMVKTNLLNYSNSPMKYYVSIANATKMKDKIAMYLVIDNVIQSFNVDDQSSLQNSFEKELGEGTLINIPVTFTPKVNDKLEEHTLWIVLTTRLDEKPDENKHIPYFASSLRFKLDSSGNSDAKSVDNLLQMKGSIIKKYSNLEQQKSFRSAVSIDENNELYQKPILEIEKKQNVQLKFQAVNKKGSYSTVFFVNNKPIQINGSNSLLWEIESDDQMLSQDITFNMPELTDSLDMFSITFPLKKSEILNDIDESEKFGIKMK